MTLNELQEYFFFPLFINTKYFFIRIKLEKNGKNILSLLLGNKSTPKKLKKKNSTFLTPNISHFSKQDLEKPQLKRKIDSREHILGMRRLRFEVEG